MISKTQCSTIYLLLVEINKYAILITIAKKRINDNFYWGKTMKIQLYILTTIMAILSLNIFIRAGGSGSCMSKAQTHDVANTTEQNQQQPTVQNLPSVTLTMVPDTSTVPQSFVLAPAKDHDEEISQSRAEPVADKQLALEHAAKNLPLSRARALLMKHHREKTKAIIGTIKNHHHGPSLEKRASVMVQILLQRSDVQAQWPQWLSEDEAQAKKVQAAIALQEAENQRTARALETHRQRGNSDADRPQARIVDLSSLEIDHKIEDAERKAIAAATKTRLQRYAVQDSDSSSSDEVS
jgi:hypothetical protein